MKLAVIEMIKTINDQLLKSVLWAKKTLPPPEWAKKTLPNKPGDQDMLPELKQGKGIFFLFSGRPQTKVKQNFLFSYTTALLTPSFSDELNDPP